jgi:M6 family metalloprotease-like protein
LFGDVIQGTSPSRADVLAGTLSVAVVLVNFPDKANVKTRAEINALVFTQVNEYWKEVSYGKISLKGTTTSKWYTLQSTYSYYGQDPDERSTSRRLSFVNEAVSAADGELNYKEYGYIIVVHAGGDQAMSEKDEDIWSFGSIGALTLETGDGTIRAGVSVVSEMDPVGPVAHEMGHNFGLPDLWDYNYDFSKGYPNGGEPNVGEWDLMGHGLWAGNGHNPTHLSSYSKIRLGWILDSQIANVGINENRELTIQPLAGGVGTLVVRTPLTKTTYYLVEARKRIGRDSHIPGEGIIIYYVDETKGSGQGPVKVRSKTPPYPDTGAWQAGDTYFHQETGFKVAVGGATGGGYGVAFGPAAQPPVTTFTVTIQAPYSGLTVSFAGKSYTTDSTGTVRIQNVTAGQYTVQIQSSITVSEGTRRGFVRWSDGNTANPRTLTITTDATLKAEYRTEHKLTIISKYGNITGAGWYESDSTATITLTSTTVDHGNGTRRVFTGWGGDLTGTETTKTIVMSAPKSVTVSWTTQYQLKITSNYGNPQGAGWYAVGTKASFSVTTPFLLGDVTRQIFTGWTGDFSGSSPSGTIVMDKPKTITANWRAQYLVNMQFLDAKGRRLMESPSSVKIASPNATVTTLTSFVNIWLDEGTWTLKQVIWHGVDVKKAESSYNPKPRDTWTVQLRVYSLTVKVTSSLTGWTVAGATVTLKFPDESSLSNQTNNQGLVTFSQLPVYEGYRVVISAQGMSATITIKLIDDTTKVVSIWLLTDILMVVGAVVGVLIVAFIGRRRRMRVTGAQAMEDSSFLGKLESMAIPEPVGEINEGRRDSKSLSESIEDIFNEKRQDE